MGSVNKTIALTDQEVAWVNAQVESGRYASENEYISDLIRSDQESSRHVAILRNALIEGEDSGAPETFDAEEFKQRMMKKYG